MKCRGKSDGNKTTFILEFDPKNTQENYEYIAKKIDDGKYVSGYIVVRQPWYSCESLWTYYIYYNNYNGAGGLCGSPGTDKLDRIEVDGSTVEPFNQIGCIKLWHDTHDILIVKDINKEDEVDNIICRIGKDDRIPIELWDSQK